MAVPIYVALCLVLGGSAQAIFGNMLLQLIAVAILAWVALAERKDSTDDSARFLMGLSLAAILLILAQLLPLPPSMWSSLPGRASVVEGYRLMGLPLPWLPWSLAPYQTLSSGLAMLPPLAVLLGMIRVGAYRPKHVAMAIVAATLAGVILGAVQAVTGRAYLYRFTSTGQAAGFFANANYMGTLFLAAIPFLAGLLNRFRAKRVDTRRRTGIYAAGAAGFLVLLLGLALNGSSAALLLSLPVLLASAALLISKDRKTPLVLVSGAVVATVAGCLALAAVPGLAGSDAAVSVSTRKEIYAHSLDLAAEVFPVGAGVGAFARIYPTHEDADAVDRVYVNHVHNEYLEVLIEAGLPGAVLLLIFLVWWAWRTIKIWRSPLSSSLARAATIASAAILAHSFVDFPVRTAAIAAVFAAALGLMAEPMASKGRKQQGLRGRPARHMTLE